MEGGTTKQHTIKYKKIKIVFLRIHLFYLKILELFYDRIIFFVLFLFDIFYNIYRTIKLCQIHLEILLEYILVVEKMTEQTDINPLLNNKNF